MPIPHGWKETITFGVQNVHIFFSTNAVVLFFAAQHSYHTKTTKTRRKKTSIPPKPKPVGLVGFPSLQGLVRWEPRDLDKWTRWNLRDGGKQGFASGNKRVATLRHAFFSIRMYIIFGGQGFLVDFFRGKKGSFLGGYTPLKKKTNAGSPEH